MPSKQPPIPDDPVLGAVVAEVADHQQRLAGHDKRLDEHGLRMVSHETAIDEVRDGFGALSDTFAKLSKRLDEVPKAVCWITLNNQEATKAWGNLRAWVEDVLVARYPHVTSPGGGRLLPPCWYLHPYLVEELSALRLAWCHAFQDPTAPPTAPNEWHKRLADCRARVSETVKCANTHNADRPAGEPVDSGFGAFIAADIAARPDPPASTD